MSIGLECRGLVIERTGSVIVHPLDLTARVGEVTVVLGPNGAGKTTLLEGVSGLIPLKSGSVQVGATDMTRLRRGRRARGGLAHVEQGRPVFGELTVEENLSVAAPRRKCEHAYELFPELDALRHRKAGLLSGGEQQMLVIARAIVREPTVLLLDEMSLGLAPVIVGRILPRLRALAETGAAVVLVEQFAQLALRLGDTAYVLSKGTVAYHGPCQPLLDNPGLLHAAYLGEESADTLALKENGA
ncbi:ABC transporter ATP-binding protein [Streptomyces sp. NPDC048179]|uniref:ABC transporter ATP-binding protein n=1 Tax=Streptomyces sp. NPDC048179 TaxID=3365506 RepID=UPI00370FA563